MARSARVDEALNVLAAAAVTVAVGTTLLVIAVLIGNLVGLNQLAVAGILLAVAITHLPDGSVRIERIGGQPVIDTPG